MLTIATPKTANAFIARMTEVEKMLVRGAANQDRLEYLRQNDFAVDMLTPEVMAEAKTKLMDKYSEGSNNPKFGNTWLF